MIGRLRSLAIAAVVVVTSVHVAPARAESADTPRTEAQLEQMVAPIALYPDALLAQVLMASTYPLEVAEAARWSRDNSGVTGETLEDAMREQPWDPSVKSLTAVPPTLQMMSDKPDWTRQLGDAFLAQQKDVLAAIQRLRARADAAGNLNTTPQQKVAKVRGARPTRLERGAGDRVHDRARRPPTNTTCRSTIPASCTGCGPIPTTLRSTGIRPTTSPTKWSTFTAGVIVARRDLGSRRLVATPRQHQRRPLQPLQPHRIIKKHLGP